MKIGIIGGGINGFCCGVQIKERLPAADVTIISELFTPDTTGDVSAGLWGPYLMGDTPQQKVIEWSSGMHNFLKKIWLSGDAGEAGVCLIPVIRLSTGDVVDDFWKHIVYGCKTMDKAELDAYSGSREKKFTSGLHFVTYTSEPIKLLPYLGKRFKAIGGRVINQKVENFDDFVRKSEYDVIINCTGLGARFLLKDELIHPVRGQVTRVKANWMYHVILDESDDGNYIIPNVDSVILGGTHQENDYNLTVCPKDLEFITSGCQGLVPGLRNTEHLKNVVGLRPGRRQVRLEMETLNNKLIIHNYGHGGSGVTLAWGCATEVLELLLKGIKSKL